VSRGSWVTVPDGLAARHPLHGLDDGAAMLVLALLFGPLLLLAQFFGVVVPAVRSGVEGAEALWDWLTPYLIVAAAGWAALAMLANRTPLVIRVLPVWVAMVVALMAGFGLDAGLPAGSYAWRVAAVAAVGIAGCLYAAYAPRMRVTLRRQVRREEVERLRAAEAEI
jgi:hypothetical protein